MTDANITFVRALAGNNNHWEIKGNGYTIHSISTGWNDHGFLARVDGDWKRAEDDGFLRVRGDLAMYKYPLWMEYDFAVLSILADMIEAGEYT